MVKKKNIIKNALREISLNKKTFISLLLIIIIGAGLFVGLKSTPLDMKITTKNYYKDTNLFDLRVISSSGFTKNDIDLIKQIPNVKGVSLSKQLDAKTTINNKDFVIKLNSINKDRNLKNDDYINRLTLTSGRYPSTINEGLVEEKLLSDNNLSIGDLITLEVDDKDSLRAKKIKIVGTVKSSYYALDGLKDYFLYLEENNFNLKYYTDCFVTINEAYKYDTYSKKYDKYIESYKEKINAVVLKSSKFNYENDIELLKNDITSLQDDLNKFNQSDLPVESLNELVKETTDRLNKKETDLSKINELNVATVKRSDTSSFNKYYLEIERFGNISKVFSFMFLLISILVIINKIAKVIKEDKDEIKTLSLIGYSKTTILFKYIFYGTCLSILGTFIGTTIFYKIIPLIIGFCYNRFYDIPTLDTMFQIKYFIEAIILSLVLIILATIILFIIINKNKNTSVKKKIILEKINKIWSKLSFLNKVTFKNIFKDKKRSLIIIIMTCILSSLILISIGIKDLVSSSINNQFKNIEKYNLNVNINNNITEDDKVVLENAMIKNKKVKDIAFISKRNVQVRYKNGKENAMLIIPNNVNNINNFILLKENKKNLEIKKDGVIISKKLAKLLNVNKNNKIKLTLSNNKVTNVKVSAITENYIEHFIYMSPTLYKKLTGEKPSYSVILINTNKKNNEELENEISNLKNVTSIQSKKNIKEEYNEMTKALKSITNLLNIFTLIIGFLALYNILITDISNRKDEIYTLKKLGFNNKEIVTYFFKENLILTIIGIGMGIFIGSLITCFVVKSLETNTLMFNFNINILSYLLTFVFSLLILCIVSIFAYYKFKNKKY